MHVELPLSSLPEENLILAQLSFNDAAMAETYAPIVPFSVRIENRSREALIGYAVIWKLRDKEGRLRTLKRSVFDLASDTEQAPLPPGRSRVVSPVAQCEQDGQDGNEEMAERVLEVAQDLAAQAEVAVVLDAAVFLNGRAVGPDESGSVARWKAWVDAEREVLRGVVDGPPDQIFRTLQILAEEGRARAQLLTGDADEQPGSYAGMADRAVDYDESFALAKAHFALAVLGELAQGGAAAIHNIQSIVESQQYPEIGRV